MPPRVPLLRGATMQGHIPTMSTPGVVQMGSAMPMAPHGMPSVMPRGAMTMMAVPMAAPAQMQTNAPTRPQTTITAEEKKEWESTYAQAEGGGKEKKKKDKKFLRVAGGQIWEDNSLSDWDSGNGLLIQFLFFTSFFTAFLQHSLIM